MDQVKIISLNVNGLAGDEKRKQVFAYLKKLQASIFLLQETHSVKGNESTWAREWGGPIYFSHGTSASRGVAVLFRRGFQVEVRELRTDEEGRYLIMELKVGELDWILTTVYGPNDDNPEFYVKMFREIESKDAQVELPIMIVGDFNVTLDPEWDYRGSQLDNPTHVRKREVIQTYMENKDLEDIWRSRNPEQHVFTWRRDGSNFQSSRLDYFLISQSLTNKVKETLIKTRFQSDHSRIELVIDCSVHARGRSYWKFNTRYLKDRDFLEQMNGKIETFLSNASTMPPDKYWECLKLEIAVFAKEFSISKVQATNRLIELLENKLIKLDRKMANVQDPVQKSKISKDIHRTEVFLLDEHEEMTEKARFRSRCKYYLEGERNTKYFFNLEKAKYNSKAISVLHSEHNIVITDPRQILAEQALFYKRLYKRGQAGCTLSENNSEVKLSEREKTAMEEDISLSELSVALKAMQNEKTPGDDGLPAEFYKVFWSKIGETYFQAVKWNLERGRLHDSALRGVITLLPKKDRDLRFLTNWRPLTLLNVDYKILSKALALRIKPKLKYLIHEDQTGFMEGRNIAHNLRKIIDIVQFASKKQLQICIISIDYEKCFDRIPWGAVDAALDFFNFGPRFRQYVQILFKDSCARVQNNGHFSEVFQLQRGVKQGEGISPYLHLLISEILAIRLRNNPKIQGVKMEGKEYKLVQFADDLNLFLHFSRETFSELTNEFDVFERETDFKVNYDKTSVYRVGSLKNSNACLYTGKPFKWSNSPPKVLGITISTDVNDMQQQGYDTLLAKVKKITNIWKVRSLSLIGKTVVINSLIASLYVYRMNVLPSISQSQCKELEQTINDFLWDGKCTKIPINVLQNTKANGGLKLFAPGTKDGALKIAWLKAYRDYETIRVLANQFLPPYIGELFWYCNINIQDICKILNPSFWRDVALAWSKNNFGPPQNKEQVLQQVIWYNSYIRIGGDCCFYRKAWQQGVYTINDLFNSKEKRMLTFAEFSRKYNECLNWVEYTGILSAIPVDWKRQLLQDYSDPNYIANFDYIQTRNSGQIYIDHPQGLENKCQKWETKLNIELEYEDYLRLFLDIYTLTINPKLRSFQFRLLHRKIFLNKILYTWKLVDSPLCPYCQKDYETIEHRFYDCEMTLRFWELLQNWYECLTDTVYNLSKTEILLNTVSDFTLNAVVLCAKFFIFSRKCQDKYINFYIFKDLLREQIRFEWLQAKRRDTKTNWNKFRKKWGKIIRI